MLKVGIVGLPNVGKSTLFNTLVGTNQAAASNFPFCTIEPNTGIVPVPDPRLDQLAKMEKSDHIVPTTIEFVDIAGLVKGASQGQGLGNQFLSYVREVDAIIHVVRLFEDNAVTHVTGNIYPQDDIETINTELLLADLQVLDKRLAKETKAAKTDPELQPKVSLYQKLKQHLEQEMPARTYELSGKDKEADFRELNLLSAKPLLYVANVDEEQLQDESVLVPIRAIVEQDKADVIAINARAEAELVDLKSEEKQEYLKELGLDEPGLNQVIRASYKLLNLITWFTAGPKETRAWTVKQGASAVRAAAVIHTDFAKGFIRAETTSFDDLVESGSWTNAKQQGKVRSEGKDYVVQDGDVIIFRFNV